MIKPEQISQYKDLSDQYKVFSGKYKDLTKYLEIKLDNQSFSTINQNIDIKTDNFNFKPTNQMENNLLGQANNNKGIINSKRSQTIKIKDIIHIKDAHMSKTEAFRHFNSLKEPLSTQIWGLYALKEAIMSEIGSIWGLIKDLPIIRYTEKHKRLSLNTKYQNLGLIRAESSKFCVVIVFPFSLYDLNNVGGIQWK